MCSRWLFGVCISALCVCVCGTVWCAFEGVSVQLWLCGVFISALCVLCAVCRTVWSGFGE